MAPGTDLCDALEGFLEIVPSGDVSLLCSFDPVRRSCGGLLLDACAIVLGSLVTALRALAGFRRGGWSAIACEDGWC